MPVNTKAIKTRIKSVKNTKKITKAMEMVAAAKMRKAVDAAVNTRAYAQMAWDLLVHLSGSEQKDQPLLAMRPVKKILLLLVTSNRGLCGSFNSNIIKKTAAQLADPQNIAKHRTDGGEVIEPAGDVEVEVIAIGKKGVQFCKTTGANLRAAYTDVSDTPKFDDIAQVAKEVLASYEAAEYDKVVIGYTEFKSSLVQEAKLRQVLPVSKADLEKTIAEASKEELEEKDTARFEDYVFEPSKAEVLSTVLPRLVESQIYQSVLESAASEHSARMMAMRNASEAADEMVADLTLSFNKARQAGITQEISEIAGGAAALE